MIIKKERKDLSYGIIPLKRFEGQWRVLLVHHIAGHWSFPKGHPEEGESPKETASRELHEETGLKVVAFLSEELLEEKYVFSYQKEKILKTVRYFIAQVDGKEYPQLDELFGCEWFSFDEAREKISFPNTEALLDQTINHIKEG